MLRREAAATNSRNVRIGTNGVILKFDSSKRGRCNDVRLGGKRTTPADIEKARAEFSRRLRAEMKTTSKKDELAELRRENQELRKTVAQLTKQLPQQEEKANERHQELLNKLVSPQSEPAEKTTRMEMDQTPGPRKRLAPGPSKRPAPEISSDDDEEGFQEVKPRKRPAKKATTGEGRQQTDVTNKVTETQPPKPARIPLVVLQKQEKWGETNGAAGARGHNCEQIQTKTRDDRDRAGHFRGPQEPYQAPRREEGRVSYVRAVAGK